MYDDNKPRIESLEYFLRLSTEFEFVGGFTHCNEIINNIEDTNPDLILMDIEMPGISGIEAVRLVKQQYPAIKIVMQTSFDDDEKVFAALQAGAEGYILKSASIIQLAQGIDDVVKGGAFMSPSIALKVMRYFNSRKEAGAPLYKLTPRETEVLKSLSQGLSYKMVADSMGLSFFTVNNHIRKIYEKLQVNSMGEAIAMAHKGGLV